MRTALMMITVLRQRRAPIPAEAPEQGGRSSQSVADDAPPALPSVEDSSEASKKGTG